jgi:type IV pilus assembly protein PilN
VIKINLNKKNVSKQESVIEVEEDSIEYAESRKKVAMRLLTLLVIPFGMYSYQMYNLDQLSTKNSSLNRKVSSLTSYNKKLATTANQIEKLIEEKDQVEAQIDKILKLSKKRLNSNKILDRLQDSMPEKAWLTKVEMDETKLKVSGISLGDEYTAILLENLQKSTFFTYTNFLSSKDQENNNSSLLKKFEFECGMENQ